MSGWRTIESAPKDGTHVLIAVPIDPVSPLYVGEARFHEDEGWWWVNNRAPA